MVFLGLNGSKMTDYSCYNVPFDVNLSDKIAQCRYLVCLFADDALPKGYTRCYRICTYDTNRRPLCRCCPTNLLSIYGYHLPVRLLSLGRLAKTEYFSHPQAVHALKALRLDKRKETRDGVGRRGAL